LRFVVLGSSLARLFSKQVPGTRNEEQEMPALHISVAGQVQGVGFRWACRRQAQALGLAGWVRNRADGSVEIHVEGNAAALEPFAAWCREGPAGAVVRRATVQPAAISGAVAFVIRLDEE
jgi:acylphosphatase